MKIKDDVNVIDIRDNDSYNKGHILNSVNVPYDELMINYDKYLNSYENYYIYCDMGKKSVYACYKLSKLGFHVINILGGYNQWIKYN